MLSSSSWKLGHKITISQFGTTVASSIDVKRDNPPKRPSFDNVSVKFDLNRLYSSRDISVLKDVAQAKFFPYVFIHR